MQQNNNLNYVTYKPNGGVFGINIRGELKDSTNYVEELDVLSQATDLDTVHIKINSTGGDLFTAIEFINAMRQCKGYIITEVTGEAASAVTLITLQGDEIIIHNNTQFMCHTAKYGTYDTVINVADYAKFSDKYLHGLLYEHYEGFLTDEELEDVCKGKQVWLTGEEVNERLPNFLQVRTERNTPEPNKAVIKVTGDDITSKSKEEILEFLAEGIEINLDELSQ